MANTMTQTHTIPLYPETTPASLLLVILDLHPLSWSILASATPAPLPSDATHKAPNTSLSLTEFINILVVFLNAHLAVRWGNQVVVYGASAGTSKLLYPTPSEDREGSKPKPNMYAPFARLDKTFESSLRGMFEEEQERLEGQQGKGLNDPPAIVSALTKALSYINRVAPHSPSSALTQPTDGDLDLPNSAGTDKLETRIMVINATPGSSSAETSETEGPKPPIRQSGGQRGGYVGMMNCVFAAQKAKVPIDVLTLPPTWTGSRPPIFLQQASHLTEGVYWRWNGRGGLLQYLHSMFLVSPSLRSTPFAVPPQDAVDFRAVCFCHHDVVDVGFVCSVCLSIFCKPLPVCLMCKTKFPIKSIPILKALGANIEPITLPETVPSRAPKKLRHEDGHNHEPNARSGRRGGHAANEPIEVD